jgi:hypothetical protein
MKQPEISKVIIIIWKNPNSPSLFSESLTWPTLALAAFLMFCWHKLNSPEVKFFTNIIWAATLMLLNFFLC